MFSLIIWGNTCSYFTAFQKSLKAICVPDRWNADVNVMTRLHFHSSCQQTVKPEVHECHAWRARREEDHEAICLLCTCVFTESSSCAPTTALCKQPTPRQWEQRQVGCRTRSTGETELHCCWSLKPSSPALRCSSPRAWPWPGPLSLLAALLRRGWRALPAGSAVKQLSGQNNQPQEESHAFRLPGQHLSWIFQKIRSMSAMSDKCKRWWEKNRHGRKTICQPLASKVEHLIVLIWEQVALITSLIDYLFESENQDVYMKVSWGILHNIYKLHKDVIRVLAPEEDFYWGGASAECLCTVCMAATGVRAPANRTQRAFHSPTAQSWTLFVRSQMAVAKL